MAENKENSLIESLLKAISNTQSSTELVFENLELGITSMSTKVSLNGKINLEVRPLHDKK